jgi:hypothetical protein
MKNCLNMLKFHNAILLMVPLLVVSLGSIKSYACTRTSDAYIVARVWYSDISMKAGEKCYLTFDSKGNVGRSNYKISDAKATDGMQIKVENKEDGSATIFYTAPTPGVYDLTILIQNIGIVQKGVNTMWQGYKITVSK